MKLSVRYVKDGNAGTDCLPMVKGKSWYWLSVNEAMRDGENGFVFLYDSASLPHTERVHLRIHLTEAHKIAFRAGLIDEVDVELDD